MNLNKMEIGAQAPPSPSCDDEIQSIFQTPARAVTHRNDDNVSLFTAIVSPNTGEKAFSISERMPSGSEDVCCAICLEDLCIPCFDIEEYSSTVVRTRCHHVFHRQCLLDAKLRHKSECPCCRSLLTPPPASAFVNTVDDNQRTGGQIGGSHINSIPTGSISIGVLGMNTVNRHAIIAASSRGRDAVRRRMQEQLRQSAQHA